MDVKPLGKKLWGNEGISSLATNVNLNLIMRKQRNQIVVHFIKHLDGPKNVKVMKEKI